MKSDLAIIKNMVLQDQGVCWIKEFPAERK